MMKIKTPEGDRIIPVWAKCYCVTRHTPTYIHPYPFALPDGRELWLCPNTFHQATTLRNIYTSLNGPPKGLYNQYSSFVRQLVKMYWQLKMTQVAEVEREIKAAEDQASEMRELFENAKRVVLDGRK